MNDRVFKKRSFVKRCFKGCCSSGRCKKGGGHGKSDSHGGNDVSQEQFDFVLKIRFFPQSITKDILTFDTKRLLYYQVSCLNISLFKAGVPNMGHWCIWGQLKGLGAARQTHINWCLFNNTFDHDCKTSLLLWYIFNLSRHCSITEVNQFSDG